MYRKMIPAELEPRNAPAAILINSAFAGLIISLITGRVRIIPAFLLRRVKNALITAIISGELILNGNFYGEPSREDASDNIFSIVTARRSKCCSMGGVIASSQCGTLIRYSMDFDGVISSIRNGTIIIPLFTALVISRNTCGDTLE